VQVLKKEKSSVIEQLRAADRSGREAREEGKQLVIEWQQQHAQLDAQLKTKASRVAGIYYSLYVLYWYKSTNTACGAGCGAYDESKSCRRYSIYLLYWYKSTNTDNKY
jgi:hypothetical protein